MMNILLNVEIKLSFKRGIRTRKNLSKEILYTLLGSVYGEKNTYIIHIHKGYKYVLSTAVCIEYNKAHVTEKPCTKT